MSLEITLKSMIEGWGAKLYDTEMANENGRAIFRVYVTKEGGINLDDCAELTHLISPLLDVEEPVKGEYVLEVSSPGVERKLKKLEHFEGSIGELAKVTMLDGTLYQGKILAVEENTIKLEEASGELMTFSFEEVIKARTYFEW